MKKLEHGMLLDAKKADDLGIGDYLFDAYKADNQLVLEGIYARLIEALASCDVSKRYKEIDNG
jgi:hypothetical protein